MPGPKCKEGCTCGRHTRQPRGPYPPTCDCGWVGTVTDDAHVRSDEKRWHLGKGRDFARARAVPICPNAPAVARRPRMTVEEIRERWPVTHTTDADLTRRMSDATLDAILDDIHRVTRRWRAGTIYNVSDKLTESQRQTDARLGMAPRDQDVA